MESDKLLIETVPWQNKDDWYQVQRSIKHLSSRHKKEREHLINIAEEIKNNYLDLFSLIEEICSKTCVNCKDICCKKATVWFDLKDLLFLYFVFNRFPENQISKSLPEENHKGFCSNLTINGCSLSRINRPFICTWYFCPDQINFMIQEKPFYKTTMDEMIFKIKAFRNQLEEEFIKRTSQN